MALNYLTVSMTQYWTHFLRFYHSSIQRKMVILNLLVDFFELILWAEIIWKKFLFVSAAMVID